MSTRLHRVLPLLSWLLIPLALAGSKRLSDLDLQVVESDIEPAVTVKSFDNRSVEEYRVNNNLYMVRITPAAGPSYYLVDDDGSGDMELRRDTGGRDINVPQWTLFSW